MSKDFLKGVIVGVAGLWTAAVYRVCKNEMKENKRLKEIIEENEKA